jgi:hypothetical protein
MTASIIKTVAAVLLCAVASLSGCHHRNSDSGQSDGEQKDPHIMRHPGDFKEDPEFVSPPTLGYPIYACGTAVTVSNFIPGAKIEVFIDGAPAPNPSFTATADPALGQAHDTGMSFTEGKVIYVTQTYNGATSAHSNSVTVTSHTADYPMDYPSQDCSSTSCSNAATQCSPKMSCRIRR